MLSTVSLPGVTEEQVSPVVSPPKPRIDDLISSVMQEPVFGMDDTLSDFAEGKKAKDRKTGMHIFSCLMQNILHHYS